MGDLIQYGQAAEQRAYVEPHYEVLAVAEAETLTVEQKKQRIASLEKKMKEVSDRYVEDGSFLRIKHISLRFTAPKKWCKALHANAINAYLTVNNLFCFTEYSGTDPEVAVQNFNTSLPGVAYDKSRTPRSKDWTMGISATF